MTRIKKASIMTTITVEDAVSEAFSMCCELRDELDEVISNVSGTNLRVCGAATSLAAVQTQKR